MLQAADMVGALHGQHAAARRLSLLVGLRKLLAFLHLVYGYHRGRSPRPLTQTLPCVTLTRVCSTGWTRSQAPTVIKVVSGGKV